MISPSCLSVSPSMFVCVYPRLFWLMRSPCCLCVPPNFFVISKESKLLVLPRTSCMGVPSSQTSRFNFAEVNEENHGKS
jgi:hypothetical protein